MDGSHRVEDAIVGQESMLWLDQIGHGMHVQDRQAKRGELQIW